MFSSLTGVKTVVLYVTTFKNFFCASSVKQ